MTKTKIIKIVKKIEYITTARPNTFTSTKSNKTKGDVAKEKLNSLFKN